MGWTASPEQAQVLAIIPHVTGLLSFLGSLSIIIMILRDCKTKMAKPYYRLLLGMSVFDALSSIGFGLSTFPIPAGTPGVHNPKGNVASCTAQGFLIQAGIASPIYNFMLSFYFLIRVKYGWNEKRIARCVEPIMHAITITFALGTSFLCLGLDLFNNSTLWCWVNASPMGCDQSYANDGVTNCERGDNAGIYRWFIFFGPLWTCAFACMVIMALIFHSVRAQENKLKQYQFSRSIPEANKSGNQEMNAELHKKRKEDDRRRTRQSRNVARQALRFVGVFYLTWLFATVNRIMQAVGGTYFWLMLLHSIFVPMQGFFNFLVYLYPRYSSKKDRKGNIKSFFSSTAKSRTTSSFKSTESKTRKERKSSITGHKNGNALKLTEEENAEEGGESNNVYYNVGRSIVVGSWLRKSLSEEERVEEGRADTVLTDKKISGKTSVDTK